MASTRAAVCGPIVAAQVMKREGQEILGADGTPIRLPREAPGLFVQAHCEHFQRTVPVLPRDDKDLDDVDSDAEDHVADETRYEVRHSGQRVGTGRTVGLA